VVGELRPVTGAGDRLEPGAIAVVVGNEESRERFGELCGGARSLRRSGPFVVGGFGEVGRKVVQLLRDAGEEVVTIDRRPADGVDRVGDVLDSRVLEEAGALGAQAIVLALDTDAATLFAVVIAKEVAPEVPVIARVNQAGNVDRTYRAGADFALSISQVSGQILARRLLGVESVAIDARLEVRKVEPGRLVGRAPSDLDVRGRTGCSVVAVERGDQVLVEAGPDFRVRPGDSIFICGPADRVSRFAELLRD
jgi:Trk K+ transport system NAD-binding subunit